jgi:hypothetical protein
MINRTLELESSIKTVIGELDARIELIERDMIDELSDYTKGRLDIYKEVVEMLEDVLK